MERDFHIYQDPSDGSYQMVFDEHDPQLKEILDAMGDIFNGAQRPRECDECRNLARALEA